MTDETKAVLTLLFIWACLASPLALLFGVWLGSWARLKVTSLEDRNNAPPT